MIYFKMLYAILPIGGTEKYVTQGSRLHITFDKYKVLSLHKLPTKLTIENQNISQGGFVTMQILVYKKIRDGYAFKKIRRHNYQRKIGIRKFFAEVEIKEIHTC